MGVIDNIKKKVQETKTTRRSRSHERMMRARDALAAAAAASASSSSLSTYNIGRRTTTTTTTTPRRSSSMPLVLALPSSSNKNHHGADDESRQRGFSAEEEQQQQLLVVHQQAAATSSLRMSTSTRSLDPDVDLGRALQLWVSDAHTLLQSPEFHRFMQSSQRLVGHTVGTAWQIAWMPVTLPLHVATSTTGFVVHGCTTLVRHSLGKVAMVMTTSNINKHNNNNVRLLLDSGTSTSSARRYDMESDDPPRFEVLEDGDEDDDYPHDRSCVDVAPLASGEDTASHESSQHYRRDDHQQHPLVQVVTQDVVPLVLNSAGIVKDHVAGMMMGLLGIGNSHDSDDDDDDELEEDGMISPLQRQAGETSAEGKHARDSSYCLDRLRLDYIAEEREEDLAAEQDNDEQQCENAGIDAGATPASTGTKVKKKKRKKKKQYYLPVYDLDLKSTATATEGPMIHRLHLTGQPNAEDTALMNSAVDVLIQRGKKWAQSQVDAGIEPTLIGNSIIQWKTEGCTEKYLRRKKQHSMSSEEWMTLLEKEVLIWSGSLVTNHATVSSSNARDADVPIYLSRGIVTHYSPKEFMELLWDDDRTREYNRFCMGRSTQLVLQQQASDNSDSNHNNNNNNNNNSSSSVDNSLSSPDYKTKIKSKVVKSETKVPFTGLTVHLSTLMHWEYLEEDNSYVIVSRSLDVSTGKSQHPGKNKGSNNNNSNNNNSNNNSNNDILLGLNWIRPVKGHVNKTDLLAVSQVRSSMVPQFLASRVGIMGVENLFGAFRSLSEARARAATPGGKKTKTMVTATKDARCATTTTNTSIAKTVVGTKKSDGNSSIRITMSERATPTPTPTSDSRNISSKAKTASAAANRGYKASTNSHRGITKSSEANANGRVPVQASSSKNKNSAPGVTLNRGVKTIKRSLSGSSNKNKA